MKRMRFLLPFTERIDLGALAYAVRFAKKRRATVVPLALIPLSEPQWVQGPRLEAIEQANDFLEAVKYQAARVGVRVEPCAIETRDVVQSLVMFAREMMCEGILLFLRGGATVLLPCEAVKHLLDEVPTTVFLVRLPPTSGAGAVSRWLHWIFERIRCKMTRQEKTALFQGPAVPRGITMVFLPGGEASPHRTRWKGMPAPRQGHRSY